MKRFFIFILTFVFVVCFTQVVAATSDTSKSTSSSTPSADTKLSSSLAVSVDSKSDLSENYWKRNRRSVSASTAPNASPLAATAQTMFRGIDSYGWDDPFLPGGNGWESGGTGNIGYPIGDISLPILLSMLIIYFIYRGTSSTKRRNNF